MTKFMTKANEISLKLYFKLGKLMVLPFALLSGSSVNAQNTPIIPWNPTNISDFGGLVNTVINFVSAFVGVIAVLYLILAGFNYVISQGNAKKVSEAKAAILNAIIGIIIVLIAYLIVRLVIVDLLGSKQSTFWTGR